MKRILIVCSSGLGTSLMIRLNLQKILQDQGIQAEVVHTDQSSSSYEVADLMIGAKQIIESIHERSEVEKIALEDIVRIDYLKEKFLESRTFQKWQHS